MIVTADVASYRCSVSSAEDLVVGGEMGMIMYLFFSHGVEVYIVILVLTWRFRHPFTVGDQLIKCNEVLWVLITPVEVRIS